ncbi:hypothetical protein [Micavibrio aeruginosavorus]|uniref:Uncharacterized protein n=1 Tax=Micavibrio aeruginosavorus (strain ARL-13) TaxID=856793 RepID=G2KMW5_MICAA|nr:hypothetical protein [Micavibrio aeruginosavorus]AEP08897.1 hypothetical protein MICA_560 [Micavibrio aeruginosavorus ARL-13]
MPVIDTDTAEGKAELQKMIDKETEGLKAKKDELLGEVKKLKDSSKSIQEQLDELKAAKDAAEEEAAAKGGDVEKIKSTLEARHAKEKGDLSAKLADREAKLHKLLVDNGLTEALTKAGVTNPAHLKAAKAMILAENKAEVSDADGAAVATISGKPIQEFVSSFAQGEDGKHFIAATANSGGGAGGSNGGGKAAGGQTRSAMNHVDKAAYIKEHGQEAYLALPE